MKYKCKTGHVLRKDILFYPDVLHSWCCRISGGEGKFICAGKWKISCQTIGAYRWCGNDVRQWDCHKTKNKKTKQNKKQMKQFDVVVSPPAFVGNPYLTLTHVTFDLDPCDLWPRGQISMTLQKTFEKCNLTLKWAHLPVLYTLFTVTDKWLLIDWNHQNFFLVNFGPVPDRQTDRQTDRWFLRSHHATAQVDLNNVFWHRDLDLWSMTLTQWPWPLWPFTTKSDRKLTVLSLWK